MSQTADPATPAAPSPAPINQAAVEQRLKLESRFRSGARWFFWIGGLSVVNSIALAADAQFVFVIGLGITQFIAGVGMVLGEQFGLAIRYATLPLEFLIALLFVGFGILALKGYRWAFITGMVLYGIDTLIALACQDLPMLAFHALALFFLWSGLRAMGQLRKASEPAQAVQPQTETT